MSTMSELHITFQDVRDITKTLPPKEEEFIIEALVTDLDEAVAVRIANRVLMSFKYREDFDARTLLAGLAV